jgi:hypothetical protein
LRQTKSKDLYFFFHSPTLCHPEQAGRIRRAVVARQTNSGGEPKGVAWAMPKDLHFFLPLTNPLSS